MTAVSTDSVKSPVIRLWNFVRHENVVVANFGDGSREGYGLAFEQLSFENIGKDEPLNRHTALVTALQHQRLNTCLLVHTNCVSLKTCIQRMSKYL